MPGARMNVQKGRASLLAGLCLAIFILLLACLDNQSSTLEPFTGTGDRYTQIRGRGASNTAESHTVSRGSVPETVNTDNPVQRLSRRSSAGGSNHEFSDNGSMDSVDDPTWENSRNDGEEGLDPDKIKQDWMDALERGQKIEKLWNEGSTSPSQWTHEQIKQYGWERDVYDSFMSDPSPGTQLALDALPASSQDDGVVIRFEHKKPTTIGDKTYPATKAFYEISFRLGQHAIILLDAVGPAFTTKGKLLPEDQLVPLRHLSDFMVLEWQNLCKDKGVDPKSLKYIIHDRIYNPVSRNVARKAVGGGFLKTNLAEWPGVTFTANDALGRLEAAIGTPNGFATAQTFMQHSEILGANRRVVKAVLWKVRPYLLKEFLASGPDLFMMFELNDARAQNTGAQATGSKGLASSGQNAGPANLPAIRQV